MKDQLKDIGSIYKEAFKAYQPTPPPAAMHNIMARPEVKQMAHWTVKWMQPALWTAGAVMIAISAYVLWPEPENDMLAPGTELAADTPAPVLSIPLDNEPTLQDPQENTIILQDHPAQTQEYMPESGPENLEKAPDPKEDKKVDLAKVNETTAAKPEKAPPIPTTTKPSETSVAKQQTDTPGSALDRHRLTRTPKDTTPLPDVVLSETQYICKGESVSIGASGGASYIWNTGEKSQTIAVKPMATAVYKVTVTRRDKRKVNGEVWVNVEDCATLYVPNAFTPNNDGLNDIFKAYGKKLNSFHIQIYNGTGEVLFEADDIEEGWDGTHLGHEVETGNYFYRIVYVDIQNSRQTRNGRITLLR